MNEWPDRREFCLAGLGALLAPRLLAGAQSSVDSEPKLSLAQWSLHRQLQAGELDPLDFPRSARQVHGLSAVEYVSGFYKDRATDFAYLADLRQRAADVQVRNLLIMIDGEGRLGAFDAAERSRAQQRHFRWIAAAAYLGCHAVRVNAEGDGTAQEHSASMAESLQRLGDLAADYGLSVLVENHGGRSSDGAWLAQTMRLANHPQVGTLPDFGNFRIDAEHEYDRYRGLEQLMPFARAVSAKSYAFDAAGEETTIDYARALRIVRDAGYTGYIGIEFEGPGPEPQGIAATKALLERLL